MTMGNDEIATARDAIRNVAEGEAIVASANERILGVRRREPFVPLFRTAPTFPAPRPVPQADNSAPLSIAEMLERITRDEARGRTVLAALGVARLREFHEATNPAEPWPDFARKNVPLARDRVEELIGSMVHRGALLRCTRCGTGAKCPCGCGVPYVSDHPWANADPLTKATALERASAAVAAHPEKSNRAIAAEIGVDGKTVAKARSSLMNIDLPKAGRESAVDSAVEGRVGRDGRRRKVPAKAALSRGSAPKTDDDEVAQFIGDLLDFTFNFSQRITAWREGGPDCGQEPRDALMHTIHQCADEVLRLAQAIDGR
jgi:hypothetical protein